jgi:ATP-dependent protease HslVU (ClpYQ) peptidase subunit
MRVVGSQTITEDLHRKMVQTLPNNLSVTVAVFSKFEEELTIMTAMGQVIEFSRKEVAVGSGHGGGSIDAMARLFQRKKGVKKWL